MLIFWILRFLWDFVVAKSVFNLFGDKIASPHFLGRFFSAYISVEWRAFAIYVRTRKLAIK